LHLPFPPSDDTQGAAPKPSRTPGQRPDSPSRKSENDAGTTAGPRSPECPYALLNDLAEFVEYVQSLAHVASQFTDDCDIDLMVDDVRPVLTKVYNEACDLINRVQAAEGFD
jgi:hypothetical protein